MVLPSLRRIQWSSICFLLATAAPCSAIFINFLGGQGKPHEGASQIGQLGKVYGYPWFKNRKLYIIALHDVNYIYHITCSFVDERISNSSRSSHLYGCKTWGQHNGDPTYGRVSGINKLMSFSGQMHQVVHVETRQQSAMIKVAMLSFMYCPVLSQQCAGVR